MPSGPPETSGFSIPAAIPPLKSTSFLNPARGRAAVPSGASTGTREALELRDKDGRRYGGKGVQKAVGHVNGEIAAALAGTAADQRAIDDRLIALDGTPNKARLGANALLGVSMAAAHAAAAAAAAAALRASRVARAAGAARRRSAAAGADDEHPQRRRARGHERRLSGIHGDAGRRCRRSPRRCAPAPRRSTPCAALLKKRGLATGVGDEGGFAPSLSSNREAVELVLEAIERGRLSSGRDMFIAIDVAASEFWDEDTGPSYDVLRNPAKARSRPTR